MRNTKELLEIATCFLDEEANEWGGTTFFHRIPQHILKQISEETEFLSEEEFEKLCNEWGNSSDCLFYNAADQLREYSRRIVVVMY